MAKLTHFHSAFDFKSNGKLVVPISSSPLSSIYLSLSNCFVNTEQQRTIIAFESNKNIQNFSMFIAEFNNNFLHTFFYKKQRKVDL
jgi:hypothetical protein